MRPLAHPARGLIATAGIGLSVALWFAGPVLNVGTVPTVRTEASIDQFRRNPTASVGHGALPTFATLRIDFPSRLGLQSTEIVTLNYARFIAESGDRFELRNGEMQLIPGKPRPGAPIKTFARATSVRLESSALDVAPAVAFADEDSPLPHPFRWTITPKRPGPHKALLELKDLIAPSTDGELFGSTTITVGGKPVLLDGGTQLVLPFEVVDARNRFAWLWQVLATIPGLVGFIITYPLVVDWLKVKLRQRRKKPSE